MIGREIDVVHVGSASRDLADDDPRGWRLGGGASYSALTTARLGLRTAAVIGVDPAAASASELGLLRAAGVELMLVSLEEGPVFRNDERPGGRVQTCLAPGRRLLIPALPPAWLEAPVWSLVPVADELGEDWASAVPAEAFLGLGWQGLLRDLAADRAVRRRQPAPSPLLARAGLVGVSRHDVAPGTALADLVGLLRPGAELLVTDGPAGGQVVHLGADGQMRTRSYLPVVPLREADPTGAGDVFLAALLAGLIRPAPARAAGAQAASRLTGRDLRFAAAAASFVVEEPGLSGVPDRAAVLDRLAR